MMKNISGKAFMLRQQNNMKSSIKKILKYFGYKLINTRMIPATLLDKELILYLDFDHVLSRYLFEKDDPSDIRFIQVGAFDGITCDPLRKYLIRYDWEGVMLEPQPTPFAKLKAIYADRKKISLINAVISKENGKADLFIVESDSMPEWAKGMASLDQSNILKHENLLPGLSSTIRKAEVEAISFDTILKDHNFESIDLLQIDTEGFDAEVLKLFPFDKIKPRIIHFESKHIPRPEQERTLTFLTGMGYLIARDRDEDMMAILK